MEPYRWIYETSDTGERRLTVMRGPIVVACIDPFPTGVPMDLGDRLQALKRCAAMLATKHSRRRIAEMRRHLRNDAIETAERIERTAERVAAMLWHEKPRRC